MLEANSIIKPFCLSFIIYVDVELRIYTFLAHITSKYIYEFETNETKLKHNIFENTENSDDYDKGCKQNVTGYYIYSRNRVLFLDVSKRLWKYFMFKFSHLFIKFSIFVWLIFMVAILRVQFRTKALGCSHIYLRRNTT